MKFVHPLLLGLLALVPIAGLLWIFLRARAERRLTAIVAPQLRARLLPAHPRLFAVQLLVLLAGLALVLFAAARPRWGHSAQRIQTRSRNVVVALDVSRSMLAADVRPNRLERAKADVADLIDSLEGDRAALVAFRRTGVLLCPLTTDHAFLRTALEGASPDSAPRGETDLGSAIRTALDALDPAADDHNAIILVSDGGDLRNGALAAASLAKSRNVPIFTVGLGNPKADSTIPDPEGKGVQQYKGSAVKVRLDESTLQAIAKASGGRYVPLATAGTAETTLGAIYRRFLRQVAAKEQAEEEELRATERFIVFLVPGLALLLVAAFFSRGRFAGRRVRAAAAVAVLLCGAAGAQTNDAATAAAPAPLPKVERPAVKNAEGHVESDVEIWNRGVDAWRAGDYTNALAILEPITLSRTHGARAAELVGAIQHAKMRAAAAQDPVSAATAAEEAAAAMQIALRGTPDDPRVNRNFTRATDRVAELREAAHVAEVLKGAQNQSPDQLLGAAAADAERMMTAAKGVLTNAAARAVAESEALAARAEKLADTWITVKQTVMQSVTNEQQAAEIVAQVESARELTKRAAEALGDMDPDAYPQLAQVEGRLHQFWKAAVLPPAAIDAAILAQTNAYAGVAVVNGRAWQNEALDFTRAFHEKFPQWAQAYEQQYQQKVQQGDTNAVPFKKEAQEEIAKLVIEAEKALLDLVQKPVPAVQLAVLKRLEKIRDLLPKDPNGGGQGQPNPQQNPQQNPDQKPNPDENKKDDQQQDQQQQQPEPQKNEDKKNDEQKAPEPKEEPKNDQQVEAMLQKAKERSDKHENEKKARLLKAPLSPNACDW